MIRVEISRGNKFFKTKLSFIVPRKLKNFEWKYQEKNRKKKDSVPRDLKFFK